MAKKARRPAPARAKGGIPAPKENEQGSDFNPFLKAEDIGIPGKSIVATLTGETRMSDSGFGEQIVTEVVIGRDHYDLGIKVNTPNHRILYERFGADPRKWAKKKITLIVKKSRTAGFKDFIAIAREES